MCASFPGHTCHFVVLFQNLLFTHIRLAKAFSNYEQRIQCVQARLQAISILGECLILVTQSLRFIPVDAFVIFFSLCQLTGDCRALVYSSSMGENVNSLLYNGFIEELVDILELKTDDLVVSCRNLVTIHILWVRTTLFGDCGETNTESVFYSNALLV